MIAPRPPPPAYSSERSSSARPTPRDWYSGSTTSSDRPHTPSRSSASAAPTIRPLSSATHAPPGSRSNSWWIRTIAGISGGAGAGGSCRRRLRSAKVTTETSWIARSSSRRMGRMVATAGNRTRERGLAVLAVGLDLGLDGGDRDRRELLLGLALRHVLRLGLGGRRGLLGLPGRDRLDLRLALRDLLRLRRLRGLELGPLEPSSPARARRGSPCRAWPGPGARASPWRGGGACSRFAWRGVAGAGAAGRAASGAAVTLTARTAPAAGAAVGAGAATFGAGGVEWRTTSTPAVVPPPTSATATSAFAAIAPPVAAAAPPPAPAPAEPKAAPSAASLSPSVGSTGSATASVLRCSATSSRNARQPGHSRRWRCSVVRRSAPPRRFASCSRISSHGVSRAVRLAISEVRAWNTSAFTFCRGTSSTVAISSWETAPSSASTSAARWSSGRAATSPSSSRTSWRRWASAERCSVAGSWNSSSGRSRRARSIDRQRLRAIV